MTASSVNPTESFSRGATRGVSSPWTQIVRGESEGISSPPLPTVPPVSTSAATVTSSAIEQVVSSGFSPDAPTVSVPVEEAVGESSDNGNAGKRPAWKKPSNGGAVAAEVEPVMGAESWPALSESTKALGKSESLKSNDGSSVSQPVSQGTTTTSSSLSSQRQPNLQNTGPVRQRSMKRNGAGNTSTNGSFSQPPAPSVPLVDVPPINHSPRDATQRSGFGSHNGNNHPQRNSYRNRNGGPHPRGDGSHHHNYGGRRDQDRSNQDWNAHRSFSGRDAQLHPHRIIPRFIAPPTPAQFLPQSSVQHFGGPIAFPEQMAPHMYFVAAPHPESFRGGVPFVGPIPPPAVYLQSPDRHLHVPIVTQVDYYFSNENLIKDTYLRQNMDDQGWVSIKLIAGFKKLKLLTENIQLILDAVQGSTLVEVQGDKIRRRNDWMRWTMPPVVQFSNHANLQQPGHDMLASGVKGLNIEEKAATANRGHAMDPLPRKSESGEINNHSNQSNSEGSVPAGSDHQPAPAIN